MLAVNAIGPDIEAAVLYGGQIIRNQIGPDLITFVDDGPKFAGLRLPRQAGGIARAAGEDAMGARCPVDFPDRCAFVFRSDSVFGDVAVGSDTTIELVAIRAVQQSLGQMMIDRAT